MKPIDPNPELKHLVDLLELRPGEIVLDAQTDADLLLRFAYEQVGERGRCVGMAYGQSTVKESKEQIERWGYDNVHLLVGHPAMAVELKKELCHGVILRHSHGLARLQPVFANLDHVARPGARVLVRHTDWNLHLPKATEREQEMLDAMHAPGVKDGRDFFDQFAAFSPRGWREVRMDVYAVASRDPRASVRYGYDWRKMMRDHLGRARVFTPREILDLISRLEHTRSAKVTVERYLALGIKP